jgi:hypothetical protein
VSRTPSVGLNTKDQVNWSLLELKALSSTIYCTRRFGTVELYNISLMINCTGDIPYNTLGISLAPMPCQSALNNLTAINTQTTTGVAALEALHFPRTLDSIYNTKYFPA